MKRKEHKPDSYEIVEVLIDNWNVSSFDTIVIGCLKHSLNTNYFLHDKLQSQKKLSKTEKKDLKEIKQIISNLEFVIDYYS